MTRIFYFLLGGIILFFLLSFFLNNFVFNQVPEQIADPILTLEKKNKQIFNIDTDIGSDVEYLLGKLNYKDDNRFIEVFLENSSKHEIYLREETYQAFQQMAQDAKEDGINLNIILGARSFADQKTIWENKWSGVVGNYYLIKDEHNKTEAILKHSSMPGTSRHHWGTDIDLNNLQNSYFEKGEGLEVYNLLIQNTLCIFLRYFKTLSSESASNFAVIL